MAHMQIRGLSEARDWRLFRECPKTTSKLQTIQRPLRETTQGDYSGRIYRETTQGDYSRRLPRDRLANSLLDPKNALVRMVAYNCLLLCDVVCTPQASRSLTDQNVYILSISRAQGLLVAY